MPIPSQRDPEVARKQLTAWLATHLPQATDLELSALTGPAATGFSNDTLLFDASWTEGGTRRVEPYVARVKLRGYQVFPEVDVAMQYRCMELLGTTDVPVPAVSWFEADESVLDAPFFLMGKVEGDIPTDNPPYVLEGFLHDATPAQQEQLWWSGLEAMTRVHRVDWESLGFEFLLRPEHGRPGLEQQLGYQRAFFDWAARGRPQPIAQAAWDWLIANRPDDDDVAVLGRRGHQQPDLPELRMRGGARLGDGDARQSGDGPRVVDLPRPPLHGAGRPAALARPPELRPRRSPGTRSSRGERSGTSSGTRCSPACASPSS